MLLVGYWEFKIEFKITQLVVAALIQLSTDHLSEFGDVQTNTRIWSKIYEHILGPVLNSTKVYVVHCENEIY